MPLRKMRRSIGLLGGALLLAALAGCSSTEVDAPPTPTTAPVQQPAPAATAMSGAPAAPAATAAPGATATPQPTAAPAGEPKYGGIAVFATRGDPPGWDPMFTLTITLYSVTGSIYGRGNLVAGSRDDLYQASPALASGWESNADFTQWIFTIRDDVVWHDGTPFTAEDAKFWIELAVFPPEGRLPSFIRTIFGDLESVVADGNRLIVTLNQPTPVYLNQLINAPSYNIAHPRHLMQPEVQRGNATVSPDQVDWVALGPFKMREYVRGSVVRTRRFDEYWDRDQAGRQLPFLDGIDFAITGDPATMVAAFRTGRLDGTAPGSGFFLTPQAKDSIAGDLGNRAYFIDQPYLAWNVLPNAERAPWADVRVREAAWLWFDRQAGIQSVQNGLGVESTWWSPDAPWVNPDFLEWPGYNPSPKAADRERAKGLLAEAGHAQGFKTTLLCRDQWIPWCEYAENELAGLLGRDNVSVKIVDEPTRIDLLCKGDYDIAISGPHSELFPEGSAARFVSTNRCSDIKNDSRLDDYFSRIAATDDPGEQAKLARELERYVLQEQYYKVTLWYELASQAYRSHLKGVLTPAQGGRHHLPYDTAWLDK